MSDYIYNGGELYHYGVKGMRWGHRKAQVYDAKAASAQSRVDKKRTSLGKMSAQKKASTYAYRADRARAISDAKELRGKYEEAYGHSEASKRLQAQSQMNKAQASYAKTGLGKQYLKVSSQNSEHMAAYHQKVANSKTRGERFVNKNFGLISTPITRLSGRTTTRGKAVVESLIPGLAQIKDVKYLMDQRKSNSDD